MVALRHGLVLEVLLQYPFYLLGAQDGFGGAGLTLASIDRDQIVLALVLVDHPGVAVGHHCACLLPVLTHEL